MSKQLFFEMPTGPVSGRPETEDPKVVARREKARIYAQKKRDEAKQVKAASTINQAIKGKIARKALATAKAAKTQNAVAVKPATPAKPKAQNPAGGKTKAPTKKEQKAREEAEEREIQKEKERLYDEKRARQKEESDWEVYKNIKTEKYRNKKGEVINEQGDKDTRNKLELMKTNDADGGFMKLVKKELEQFYEKFDKELEEKNKKRADDFGEWRKQMIIDNDKWNKDLRNAVKDAFNNMDEDDKAKIIKDTKKLFKKK